MCDPKLGLHNPSKLVSMKSWQLKTVKKHVKTTKKQPKNSRKVTPVITEIQVEKLTAAERFFLKNECIMF